MTEESLRSADSAGGRDLDISARAELFATLVGGSQRKLFLYILSLVANPADAEDILQETNLILWRKFEEFRPGSDFLSWACKIAYYEVLKHRARPGKLQTGLSESTLDLLAEEARQVVQEADLRREALAKCLGQLREPIRRMVQLRYQLQVDVRQVAEIVGKSVEAVRRALHRARVALLRCIERELGRTS
ncbi:MAG: sigma-70 family RNA polymerase sigma factor [Thermoguttaceae bacterium]|nr:sigma-70 family RNA polymerase sigma factor [Thermoguttaceae bacterium]MDW8079087.1 sigma-70 family RNA polymerase sigma factor [Thermoguttaceae bacterium]